MIAWCNGITFPSHGKGSEFDPRRDHFLSYSMHSSFGELKNDDFLRVVLHPKNLKLTFRDILGYARLS